MDSDETTSMTTAKTLWTETILEVLYLALKYDRPDSKVREVLNQVRMKGCKPAYIIRKVNQKLGEQAALRVTGLLQQ